MTLEEFIVTQPCAVMDGDEKCEFGAKAVLVKDRGMVPLCNGHKGQIVHRGVERFEERQRVSLKDVAAAMVEGHRQAYRQELAELRAQRSA